MEYSTTETVYDTVDKTREVPVIKYRKVAKTKEVPVTKYREVPKTRQVEKERRVTKNTHISLFEMFV